MSEKPPYNLTIRLVAPDDDDHYRRVFAAYMQAGEDLFAELEATGGVVDIEYGRWLGDEKPDIEDAP